MQVFTSILVLGLCFSAFVYTHITDYKERKAEAMIGIARIIGSNCVSAFEFQDNATAGQILGELKTIAPDVINAVVLDKDRNIFASYKRSLSDTSSFVLTMPDTRKFTFNDHQLLVNNIILDKGKAVGNVCLRIDLSELDQIKNQQYDIAIVLLIVGLGLSFLIAFIVQRYISTRLINLVYIMKQVGKTGDYNRRVEDDGKDEISVLSQNFNSMMSQVRESQQKKDEFIGIASHELRTPLTSIKAYLQVLEAIENQQPNKEYVNKSLENVNKLQKLIFDLLDVSKIQSGQLNLNIEQFDLDALIDETIASYQIVAVSHKITRKGNKVNISIAADRQRIEQVLMNLLSNATKYSPGAKEVFISATKTRHDVTITIRDFGIGIALEEKPRIFDRFYRTKKMSVLISGFGLGLYICKDIIDRHHGRIWIDSEEIGSSFHITLPIKET